MNEGSIKLFGYVVYMWNFLFPRYCILCGARLTRHEEHICTGCLSALPYTDIDDTANNRIEQIYRGLLPLQHATAFFYYNAEESRRIIHSAKYRGNPHIAEYITQLMVKEKIPANFFDGIDFILPMPITNYHFSHRMYNQSYYIARGVSSVTGIKILTDAVKRKDSKETQTHKSFIQRMEISTADFQLLRPDVLKGKYVLVVDDVITSGATTRTLCELLAAAGVEKISVLAMAYTGTYNR